MRNGILLGVMGSALLLSCGDMTNNTSASRQKERWNDYNDPFIMDKALVKEKKYIANFDGPNKLPLEAKLPVLPWSEDYWGNYKGGLSYRWFDLSSSEKARSKYNILSKQQLPRTDLKILSPMEKLDIYMGDYDFPRTRLERRRTEIMTNSNIPTWTGLCDNWAAAALFWVEPGPVTMQGRGGENVPFGSSDVKGLLIYQLKEADPDVHFIGTNCEWDMDEQTRLYNRGALSPTIYKERVELCSGVNAGAFHLILANQIGRLNEGFIVNKVWWTEEVWNQPVFGFKSHIVSESKKKSPGAAPGTVREIEIKTVVDYIEEKDQSWNITSETGADTMEFHYRLELDKGGKIIGGAWYNDSEDRPGFAWKQEKPTFYGDEFQAIKNIYETATGKSLPEHNWLPNRPEKLDDKPLRTNRFGRLGRLIRHN